MVDGDVARHRLARERDLAFVAPRVAELLAHPVTTCVFSYGIATRTIDAGVAQRPKPRRDVRQVVQLHQHVAHAYSRCRPAPDRGVARRRQPCCRTTVFSTVKPYSASKPFSRP